ncbi:MAG: DnaJ domain-containing protein [Spirochaetales bacterium]|nr:DnaJ domain-containing protein [Spirochaetales bacterium]
MRPDTSRAIDAARRAFERSGPVLAASYGRLAGLALGGVGGGWYGALAGFALGAMVDAARRRRHGDDAPGNSGAEHGDGASPGKDEAAALLGVPADAPARIVKQAFRAISKSSHPDGPTPDPERFMAARKAYETLVSNPEDARSAPRGT